MNSSSISHNRNINRGFRKLEVWKLAIELYVMVKKKIRPMNDIPYKVKAQVEDSIFSCHSNIAEGYSRRGLKENIQFNNIALASLAENYSQIFALTESGDIDKEWFDEYDQKHYTLENKLLNYNRSQIKQLKEKSDWKTDYTLREIIAKYETENVMGD
jgi:four helix bundle protein